MRQRSARSAWSTITLCALLVVALAGCVTVRGSATSPPPDPLATPPAPAGTGASGATAGPAAIEPSTSPLADDPWTVPFLARPVSEPIRKKRGCDGIVIEGLTFRDLPPDVEAIHLERCHGVTIRANDFSRVSQAITILDSTDVRIEWNRYSDITGPHSRGDGSHRANFVQLVKVKRGTITHNKGKGGDTEDIISMFRSGGTEDAPFLIEDNHFQGTDWTSGSGSGIALGDAGSAWSIARNNTLLNPGQVGIFIAGGTHHSIIGNVIFGERRPKSNVGIYVWNQSTTECSGNEVRDNVVSWTTEAGRPNPSWDAENCGRITGWKSNDWDADLDPSTLEVTL